MGASAADDRSARPRSERSLLRSFSAIHRSPVDDTTPRQANHRDEDRNHHEMSLNDVAAAGQENQRKRERQGSVLQDRSSSRRARRVTIAPLPARHATMASPTNAGAGILQPRGQGLPPPPFASSDVTPQPPRAPPAVALEARGVTVCIQRSFYAPLKGTRLKRRPFAPLEAERARETATRLAGERLASERRRQQHYEVRRGPATPVGSGLRRDYSLGETARCASHMIVHPSTHRAARAAASLKTHDFAFLRRSDGSYTYAIVADRRVARAPEAEEFLVFVMCGAGSTKTVARRHWGSFVRLVAAEGMDPRLREGTRGSAGPRRPPPPVELEPHVQFQERPVLCQEIAPPVVCQEIEDAGDGTPPDMIIFSSSMYNDDDCSVISSLSDRAM